MSKNKCRYNRGEDYDYTCELSQDERYDDEIYYSVCKYEFCPRLINKTIISLKVMPSD